MQANWGARNETQLRERLYFGRNPATNDAQINSYRGRILPTPWIEALWSMRVRYTLQARDDLDAIYSDLDQQSPTAAQAVKDLIERRIARLGRFLLMAPVTDERGILELSIVRYPYKVYYELRGDEEVWIVHIRDTRRKSWRQKES